MRETKPMESYVNCPECGEQVQVVLKPYKEVLGGIMQMLEGSMGVEKTEHFEGGNICKCGKSVTASLHVTSGEIDKCL